MYLMASPTVWIFSASSSLISILNDSSSAMTSSTVSSESAPRSFTKEASIVTSSGSTPSCSTMMPLTFSSMLCAICFPPCGTRSAAGALSLPPAALRGRTAGRVLFRPTLHVKTAADVQDFAGDMRGARAQEERDPRRHVLGRSQATQGNEVRHSVARLRRQRLGHFGVDETRGHGVHGDRARRHLPRQRLGEAHESGLGGAVVGLPRVPHQTDDRADVHDAAVARPHHRRQHGARQLEGSRKVHGQHPVPIFAFHPKQQAVRGDPGVVHQVVGAAERLEGLTRPGGDGGGVEQIHRDRPAADPLLLALRRHPIQILPAPTRQDQIRSTGRESLSDGAPDAAGRARDQAHATLQISLAHAAPPGPCSGASRRARSVCGSSTLRVGTPGTIRLVRPVRTRPGPTSTTISAPISFIRTTLSTQRTGLVTCSIRAARSAAARVSGRAPTFRTTGTRASRSGRAARSAASRSAAGAIRAQWKGALTGRRIVFFAPLSLAIATSLPTAAAVPATTV